MTVIAYVHGHSKANNVKALAKCLLACSETYNMRTKKFPELVGCLSDVTRIKQICFENVLI